jgi:signal transduction histidine kinase
LKPPASNNESQRLAALRRYAILDTEVEPAFDAFTKLIAHICDVPIALIGLVDDSRLWFKSEIGLGTREMPRDASVCVHAILEPGLFVIPDLMTDLRFMGTPFVAGHPELRFYAGARLESSDGFPLGALCVLDHKPRVLSEVQREALSLLARQVMSQMELAVSLRAQERALASRDATALALSTALGLAQREVENRRRLMAVAGHDLKQPLQVVGMALDFFEPALAGRERELRLLGRANEAVGRLAVALDELAVASQATGAPQAAVAGESISLDAFLQQVAAEWAPQIEERGLKFLTPRSSAVVASHPRMLATILQNLIGNAIKYTDHGGILLGVRQRGQAVAIEVIDTGIGIPAEALETIFDEFTQIDPSRRGLGLGLSIAKRTADLLGHDLKVRSVPGRGTRFSLELRLAKPSGTG